MVVLSLSVQYYSSSYLLLFWTTNCPKIRILQQHIYYFIIPVGWESVCGFLGSQTQELSQTCNQSVIQDVVITIFDIDMT